MPIGRSLASLINQNLSGGGGELRPKRLPPRVKECRPNTFVQRTPVKGNFDTSRERACESLDIEVFVFCELEDEWSRLEPATRLATSALGKQTQHLCLLDNRVDNDCGQVGEGCSSVLTTSVTTMTAGEYSRRIRLMNCSNMGSLAASICFAKVKLSCHASPLERISKPPGRDHV